jgi:hypothetical protein
MKTNVIDAGYRMLNKNDEISIHRLNQYKDDHPRMVNYLTTIGYNIEFFYEPSNNNYTYFKLTSTEKTEKYILIDCRKFESEIFLIDGSDFKI